MNKPTLLKMACILFVFCAATAIASPAQVLTKIYNFQGPPKDGANPSAGLVHASDGNFYGTTFGGGANQNGDCLSTNGCGAIFKVTPGGSATLLYSFCSKSNCADGANPQSGLVQGSDGNFYGTTEVGGTGTGCFYGTCGTVFKITPQGTLTTLYSFCSQSGCIDGSNPSDALVQANDGNLYGTTFDGGTSSCGGVGCGTVFKITLSGALTTIHSLTEYEGYWPYAGLVQATDGYLYGTALNGGANGLTGLGTVFKISLSGTLTSLHSFNGDDGEDPYGGLVQASDGNFYGTADGGGANGDGTVFTITSTGTFTTLHNFAESDGLMPYAALLQATDGNFYGTTFEGGTHGLGTVFKMTPSGTLTTLHNFAGAPSDGSLSTSALVQLGPSLYGTTGIGGDPSYGIVFRLTIPRLCTVCANAE
ncbi:MAG: choice-of-anchor tandem repeat GloVer-containing protein [Candidatus Korobacteraceae bacterium]